MPQMHIISGDGTVQPMTETPYETERVLQELLARTPDLLPGELIDEADPRRWLLITREAPTALEEAGGLSLDHLFVDQDGVPTLVEVKRSSDTRLRREVVAQMLDYAAGLSLSSPLRLRQLLERRCRQEGLNADEELATLIGDDADQPAFWELVDTNLGAGHIRLIFLADRIGGGLRRIIEFLNEQFSRIEVLGIEVRQWRGEGATTLVSTVVGDTAAARAAKGRSSPERLTPEEFVTSLSSQPPAVRAGAERLMRWCSDNGGWVSYGVGQSLPACYLNWRNADDMPIWPLIIRLPRLVAIPLNGLARRPPFTDGASRSELIERLNAIDGIQLDGNRPRPNFSIDLLADAKRVDAIIETLGWFIGRLRAT